MQKIQPFAKPIQANFSIAVSIKGIVANCKLLNFDNIGIQIESSRQLKPQMVGILRLQPNWLKQPIEILVKLSSQSNLGNRCIVDFKIIEFFSKSRSIYRELCRQHDKKSILTNKNEGIHYEISKN